MSDSKTKLLPCPFCGEARDLVYHSLSSCVSCTACSAEGPCKGDKQEVIAAWNTRPAPVLTPRQEAADEMAKALQTLIDHGEPLRGDGELWSSWQVRVKDRRQAREALDTYAALLKAGQP